MKRIKALKINQEILQKELKRETDLFRKQQIQESIDTINIIIIEEVIKALKRSN
jgi:hypothetical protein